MSNLTIREPGELMEKTEVTDLTHKAYGIAKVITENGAVYQLVEIGYDPQTGKVGELKPVYKDVYEDVVDKFKTTVAEALFTRT